MKYAAGLGAACLILAASTLPAGAEAVSILDKVTRAKTLVCAAEARPGFADADDKGQVTGMALDLCRAVARAVIGPDATVRLTMPETDASFAAIAQGDADITFLSDETITQHGLAPALIPGETVFIDPVALMVPAASGVQLPADLAGHTICLITGSAGQRALEERLGALQPGILRQAFREDVEMLDAYNVGRCDATVDETSRLAEMRHTPGINHLQSRILPAPLALIEVLASTPVQDGPWASLIGWKLREIMASGPVVASGD